MNILPFYKKNTKTILIFSDLNRFWYNKKNHTFYSLDKLADPIPSNNQSIGVTMGKFRLTKA